MIYRGVVTAVDSRGVFVRVSDLSAVGVFGPLPGAAAVGGSVLVANTGTESEPDLSIIGSAVRLASATGDYTVPAGVDVVNVTVAATITLETAGAGCTVTIKNSSTGTVTVAGSIDGETSQTLRPWDSMTVVSTGTGWIIV